MPQRLACPRCKVPLHNVTAYGAVSWRCGTCRSASIGLAVLRRLAPADRVTSLWNGAWTSAGAEGDGCPSCTTRMRKLDFDGLALDACRSCMLVWFHGEELRRFAPERQESSATPSELTRAAQQAIAIAAARGHGEAAKRAQELVANRARVTRHRRTATLDKLIDALLA
jgi:Zn-finger nucleic acid-binding protein